MNDTSNVTNTHNGHEYVDLGLPSGLLWATCNVGATSPEQAGLYFAWGETTGYTAEQVAAGFRVFTEDVYNAGSAASISADLTLEQDAAHVNLGGNWRMPTYDEFQELIDNCRWGWTENYNGTGIKGCILTSKINRNSVFFPADGYGCYSSVNGVGAYGYYWSISWCPTSCTWCLYFKHIDQLLYYGGRHYGQPVRGVCKK